MTEGPGGRPVAGARVYALVDGGGDATSSATTGPDGTFVLRQLALGRYAFRATRAGYSVGEAGRTRFDQIADLVYLSSASSALRLNIPVWKLAVLEGAVRSTDSEAVGGREIQLLRIGRIGGHPAIALAGQARSGKDGAFRFSDVSPGRYLLKAGAPDSSHLPTFYPSESTVEAATAIEVEIQSQRAALEIVDRHETAYAVDGRVAVSVDTRGIKVSVRKTNGAYVGDTLDVSAELRPDGSFRAVGLGPGAYTLRAVVFPQWPDVAPDSPRRLRPVESTPSLVAQATELEIEPLPNRPTIVYSSQVQIDDRNVTDVILQESSAPRISGRVVFDGSGLPGRDQLTTRFVSVRPADGALLGFYPAGRVERDGKFATVGVPAGVYYFGMPQPYEGWFVSKVMVRGRDVTGRAFSLQTDVDDAVVTLSRMPTRVEGMVLDAQAQPVSAAVILFPKDQGEWSNFPVGLETRIRRTRSARDGRFEMPAFAGDYWIVALPESAMADWASSTFLASVVRLATPISVAPGGKATVQLRLGAGDRR